VDHFFVSRAKVRRYFDRSVGDLDGPAVLDRAGALKDGTPFIPGPDMRPVEPLCSYFFDASRYLTAKTLADYTYDLLDMARFLAAFDPPAGLLDASEDHLVAYRDYQTTGQARPVSVATWRRRRAAIDGFYDWAVQQDVIARKPYARRRSGRDALWGSPKTDDIHHLTHAQWRFFKLAGLGGQLPDGSADRAWRGTAPLRAMAAAELAVTTGMRLREFRCLLDVEVGPPRRDGGPAQVRLEATAKRGIRRDVSIQHATMREIDLYRRTERAATVQRAAAGLWRRREELFVVTDVDRARMRVTGTLHGQVRQNAIAQMPAELRAIAVTETDGGLEPMGLFIGSGGRMLSKQSWNQTFTTALARCSRLAQEHQLMLEMPRRVRVHDLRHTFAIYMLKLLTEQVAADEHDRMLRGGHDAYLDDHIAKYPLLTLQRLLGHRTPSSTMKYLNYLHDTSEIVARAVATWNAQDHTFADYAAQLSASRGS
jgi:integrase